MYLLFYYRPPFCWCSYASHLENLRIISATTETETTETTTAGPPDRILGASSGPGIFCNEIQQWLGNKKTDIWAKNSWKNSTGQKLTKLSFFKNIFCSKFIFFFLILAKFSPLHSGTEWRGMGLAITREPRCTPAATARSASPRPTSAPRGRIR